MNAHSGSWIRTGARIVVLPGGRGAPATAMEGETGPIPATPAGAVHPNVDVDAQAALVRLSKRDRASRADAWAMLAAVRAGELGGIFKEDAPVPALRARRMGTVGSRVIPAGQDAALFLGPSAGDAPLIVFRDGVRASAARLDPALRRAWRTFLLVRTSRCPSPAGAPQGALLPGGAPPANLFPKLAPRTPPPPRGLRLLCHVHVPKSAPAWTPAAAPVALDVAGMNPGFVDPVTDALVVGTSATSLHVKLRALIAAQHKRIENRIGVALVDLTGARLFAPELAGWRATVPMMGASTTKIGPLYALHQLCFELRDTARRLRLTTRAQLAAAVQKAWAARGLTTAQPDLGLFDYTEAPPRPVDVTISAETDRLIRCTFDSNENRAASLLVTRVGLPYLSSLLWQSGLFHPKRSGLWITDHYGGCVHGGDCCFPARKLPGAAPGAVAVKPRYGTTKNLTALSAATYFTLMAQGRLGDDATSRRIRADLGRACSWFAGWRLACPRAGVPLPRKCGIWNGFKNDVTLIERNVGPGCSGRQIRYAVALLTHNVPASFSFTAFLDDVDALVRANNP